VGEWRVVFWMLWVPYGCWWVPYGVPSPCMAVDFNCTPAPEVGHHQSLALWIGCLSAAGTAHMAVCVYLFTEELYAVLCCGMQDGRVAAASLSVAGAR
jgi:hypothetical protein